MRKLAILIIVVILFELIVGVPSQAVLAAPNKTKILDNFGKLPLYFIENQGQLDSQVRYYLAGKDKTLYFTPKGLTFALTETAENDQQKRHTLKLDFIKANPKVKLLAKDLTPAIISYFKGNQDQWKTGLKTYSTVRYQELWPGIDLSYTGTVNKLKYEFIVQPGADPAKIQLAYRGASTVQIGKEGQLQVQTPVGGFEDQAPYVYQEINGQRIQVTGQFKIASTPQTQAQGISYGFDLGAYDKTQPLIIDPTVILYAGYIGGSSGDAGYAIAVDSSGAAYITGDTASSEATFPATVGPDLTQNGLQDVFVAKVSASGGSLIYAGYIGGDDTDQGRGIAVDSSGAAYITGQTTSTEATFPETGGPDLTFNGGGDAFVAKINAGGTALTYAGYIGGDSGDTGYAIAVDSSGAAYITGDTSSTAATFPETVGPDLTQNGFNDAFVAKVSVNGASLTYAGYIGGDGTDQGRGIAVDSSGAAYITGQTTSTEATFPETVGPDLTFNDVGINDAFVAKVSVNGASLTYAGYIGGDNYDQGRGIAVDSSGAAYITGSTSSAEATFPETVGPDLTQNGFNDAFVAKVSVNGASLTYAGYIGGDGNENGFGIAVDSSNNAYITGETYSTAATFPVTDGPDLTYNDTTNPDAFVAKINAGGTALTYAGYIGGDTGDIGYGIAVDSSGNAYVTGDTSSTEATFPETGGPDLTFNGGGDAFVAKVGEEVAAVPEFTTTVFFTMLLGLLIIFFMKMRQFRIQALT